ncbi:unnamed protein product [Closterium sp. NIES-64]|nr:unnamed protein product [Closterium sp. NIES-65]CAI6002069.1 unnamed protein product [Closterium sp. NIES-64]
MSDTTIPQEAGTIRKGGLVFIKGRPCKVVEISTKVGAKYGRTMCHFVGTDLLTDEKVEDTVPSTHICDVPVVRTDFQLVTVENGYVTVTTPDGDTRSDFHLPTNEALASQITNGVAEGKVLVLSVTSYLGQEVICAVKDMSKMYGV